LAGNSQAKAEVKPHAINFIGNEKGRREAEENTEQHFEMSSKQEKIIWSIFSAPLLRRAEREL
jgi:hypothetical protein